MDKPVFVVGSGRCGTTIVDKCIGQHPDFCSFPFEPQLLSCPNVKDGVLQFLAKEKLAPEEIEKIIGYLGRQYKFSTRANEELGIRQWMSWRNYKSSIESLRSLGNLDRSGRVILIREFLEYVYSPWIEKSSAKNWVDGGPVNGRVIKEILSIYPEAKFVHVIRNGVDVASSFVRLGWAGGSFNQAAQFWANQVLITRLLGQAYASNNYIEIRFEEMNSQPRIVFEELFRFLDVVVSGDFLDELSKKISKKRANRYKKEVDPEDERYVEVVSKCFL